MGAVPDAVRVGNCRGVAAVGWVCSVCGRYHEDELLDIRMTLPEAVHRLPPEQRDERAHGGDDRDWCDYVDPAAGARLFVRGLLELPIPERETYFGYGVWVEVAKRDFDRLLELWNDPDGFRAPPFAGKLANALDPYREKEGLAVELVLRDVEHLPAVRLVDAEHPLVADQRAGISLADARRLSETVLH